MANEPDWITTPHIPVEYRGPTDRPFTPFGNPADATPMIGRLASVAARHPQHLAVVDDQGSLTFGQLLRSIYRLAQAIKRLRAPIPSRIVLMERMPLLPGGKIDAQALRALAGGLD